MSPEPPQSLSHFTQLMLPRVWRLEVALGLVLVGLGAALVDWPSSTARRTALLGAALALAGLGVARAALAQVPVVRRLRSTPGYTWLLRVVAVALGAMAGMAIHELAGGTGRAAVGFALAAVGFAVACSQALRWTGWWRPLRPSIDPGGSVSPGRRPRPALREVVAPARPSAGQEHPLRILVVGVLLGLGALAGLLLAPWLLWSAAVTLAVWVYGAAVGRRPKRSAPQAIRGSWRTLAAVLSYAILFVDLLIAAGGTMYVPVSLWWPVGAALLELGVVWAAWFAGLYVVITVVAALPFLPAGPDVGAPPWSATRRRRGRIGASAPWLSLMVIVGGCCGAWALTPHLWGARLGPAHDLPPMFVCWVFGVGVVVVLLDFVRRHTGRAYPALVGLTGLVVLGVALWAVLAGRVSDAWWDNGVVRAGIGIVTGTFVGVVAVASGQLALVGAPILALDWRFLTGRDAADLLPVKVATRILNARRTGDGVPAADRVHRRRAEITFPGADQPRGPLQDAIAQIFDSDRPPFFKNFLVCRTTAVELTVVPVLVTGDGPPAIELRPIVVPLPPT